MELQICNKTTKFSLQNYQSAAVSVIEFYNYNNDPVLK